MHNSTDAKLAKRQQQKKKHNVKWSGSNWLWKDGVSLVRWTLIFDGFLNKQRYSKWHDMLDISHSHIIMDGDEAIRGGICIKI